MRCGKCGKLVARYVLGDNYHYEKDPESYLRSHGAAVAEKGRDILEDFKCVQEESIKGYERGLKALEDQGKAV